MKNTAHWFVYMLECENGSYYTGSTDDLARRYGEHRKGTVKSKYTRSFRPVRIARCWSLAGTRGDAQRVEKLIQKMNRKAKNGIVADPDSLRQIVIGSYETDFGIAPYSHEMQDGAAEPARDITMFTAHDREKRIGNPYLVEVMALVARNGKLKRDDLLAVLNEERSDFICRYSFSIPTIDVIEAIVAHSPLVEIGAGAGYWARCLSEAGADIIAYDLRPPGEEAPWDWREGNQWFDDTWFNVHEGDETMAGRYPDRTLFICWPPIFDPMAANALRLYREAGGKTLIFIGSRGSTADEEFYRMLDSMKLVRSVRLLSWPGIEDWMWIYRIGA
ncbi:MAG TPA: GIY-YIG nuclease family protein [Spirochaetota bacterium]|nr:GIY-YIG nuclease family protein [Spirochaetota bacterium]HPC43297.1 GIY-YIG nuclease family protein [Spirochaetota bacterium]HQF07714.1 GIY-YIG nuclease family protein [Spirochaetota bacterium]HQH99303.1 GIY-YIG nuclease family protein [Spirochaetota bacterium]HQJ73048.1 GIY-YIG nuclease family protein [Spirochaetota bacterium]